MNVNPSWFNRYREVFEKFSVLNIMTLKIDILVLFIASIVFQVVYSVDIILDHNGEQVDFILDKNGERIVCVWARPEPNPEKCPEDGYCYIAPDDSYAFCARPPASVQDKTPKSVPL